MERGAQGFTNGVFTGPIHPVQPERWPENFRESYYLILLFKELFFYQQTYTDRQKNNVTKLLFCTQTRWHTHWHYSDAGREMEHMSNLEFLWRQSFLGKSSYVPNLRALAAEKGRVCASVLVYIQCHPPVRAMSCKVHKASNEIQDCLSSIHYDISGWYGRSGPVW
jgi:hypothetical protein